MVTGQEIKNKFEEILEESYTTIDLIPATISLNNETGDRELTEGTKQSIKVRFNNPEDKYILSPQGYKIITETNFFCKISVNIKRGDIIEYKGNRYKVENVNIYSIQDIDCFKKVKVILIS